MDAHANFPYSHVAVAPSPASSGPSLTVTTGEGAVFPTPVPFNATVWPRGVIPLASNAEIVRVTAVSTDTFTITRAQEGTSARAIQVGDQIAATVTARTLTDIESSTVVEARVRYGGNTGYSMPGIPLTGTSTFPLMTNTLEYDFFILRSSITIDRIAFNVTIGPSGAANARCGIYAADTDWQPTGSALCDTGSIAVANAFTGMKSSTVSLTFGPGRFMTVINCDNAFTVRTWRGFPTIGSVDSALGASSMISGGFITSTYGALPSAVAWTTGFFVGDHRCLMRISAP